MNWQPPKRVVANFTLFLVKYAHSRVVSRGRVCFETKARNKGKEVDT